MTNSDKPNEDSSRLTYDAKELAVKLGEKKRCIWAWARAGKIPAKRVGTKWLFPVDQIDRWLGDHDENGGAGSR